MTNPITFRPLKRLEHWLRRQPNRSDVINAALAAYRDGKPMEDKILEELERFGVTLEEIKRLLTEKSQ